MEFFSLKIILIMVLIGVLVYVISSIKDLNRRMESFGSMLSRFIEEQNNPASEPENELTAEPTLANEPPVVVPSIPVMETPPPLPVTIATQELVAAAMPAPQPVEMDVYNEPVDDSAGEDVEEAVGELAEEPVKEKRNFEKFIGENLFGKIGIVVLIIGVGFFVKYAIDKNWINETTRTILGYLLSGALLGIGYKLHKKYRTYSSLLAGGAFGIAYVTTAVAFHYYHLFSSTTAFAILVGITALMTALAWITDKRELAIVALVGGFIAPFIASNGDGNMTVLCTYLLILNVGMAVVAFKKRWSELPLLGAVATWVILTVMWSSETLKLIRLIAFDTAFFLLFTVSITRTLCTLPKSKFSGLLCTCLVINCFIYYLHVHVHMTDLDWNLYMHQLPNYHGLESLGIALCCGMVVALLWKKRDQWRTAFHSHLSLAMAFIALAMAEQFAEFSVFLNMWAIYATILFYLWTQSRIKSLAIGSFVMMCITLVGCFLFFLWNPMGSRIFANHLFITSIIYSACALLVAVLIDRNFRDLCSGLSIDWKALCALSYATGIIVFYKAFVSEFINHMDDMKALKMTAMFTAFVLLGLWVAFHKRAKMKEYSFVYMVVMLLSVTTLVVSVLFETHMNHWISWINAVVVIATIAAVTWQYSRQQEYSSMVFMVFLNIIVTLATVFVARLLLVQCGVEDFSAGLSLSLALAGVGQMVAGMRMHRKDLRVISLVTFALVIGKLIIYDLWKMPAVGKIVTFIILGIVLLVLSFMYQRLKNVLFDNDSNSN